MTEFILKPSIQYILRLHIIFLLLWLRFNKYTNTHIHTHTHTHTIYFQKFVISPESQNSEKAAINLAKNSAVFG